MHTPDASRSAVWNISYHNKCLAFNDAYAFPRLQYHQSQNTNVWHHQQHMHSIRQCFEPALSSGRYNIDLLNQPDIHVNIPSDVHWRYALPSINNKLCTRVKDIAYHDGQEA